MNGRMELTIEILKAATETSGLGKSASELFIALEQVASYLKNSVLIASVREELNGIRDKADKMIEDLGDTGDSLSAERIASHVEVFKSVDRNLKDLRTKLKGELESRLDAKIQQASASAGAALKKPAQSAIESTSFARFVTHKQEKIEALLHFTDKTKEGVKNMQELIDGLCDDVASAHRLAHTMILAVQPPTETRQWMGATVRNATGTFFKSVGSVLASPNEKVAAHSEMTQYEDDPERGLSKFATEVQTKTDELEKAAKEFTLDLRDVVSFLAVEVELPEATELPSAAKLAATAEVGFGGQIPNRKPIDPFS